MFALMKLLNTSYILIFWEFPGYVKLRFLDCSTTMPMYLFIYNEQKQSIPNVDRFNGIKIVFQIRKFGIS